MHMKTDHGAATAYLNIQWKKPLTTPSIALCKGRVVKKEGRKVFVKGSFYDAEGNILADAQGMFILMNGPGEKAVEKAKL